jgi:hypothetical protein
MEHAVTKIDPRGGAAMRDAIRLSAGELKEKAKRDKRVILVVTDGNDNASVTSLDALTRLAQQDDVLVYAIGLLTDEEKQKVKKVGMEFDVFVESTGGHVSNHTCLNQRMRPMWNVSFKRLHTTSATSTRLRTHPRMPRSTEAFARSKW